MPLLEHQKKIRLTLKGGAVGRTSRMGWLWSSHSASQHRGLEGPHTADLGPASESLHPSAGFTAPGNSAGQNIVGEEESFRIWSLQKEWEARG